MSNMRSTLIHAALRPVSNRYTLCQLASQATRRFHRPNTRIQDTMNEVLERFGKIEEAERLMRRSANSGKLAQTQAKAA